MPLSEHFQRVWRCQVVHSGYHNGVHCHEADPHGAPWNCGWRHVASLTDEQWQRLVVGDGWPWSVKETV